MTTNRIDHRRGVKYYSSQAFNQHRVVNPSAANEGDATSIRRARKVSDLIITQLADQSRVFIIKRLTPNQILGTIGSDVEERFVIG